jgi:hypothetical protein
MKEESCGILQQDGATLTAVDVLRDRIILQGL